MLRNPLFVPEPQAIRLLDDRKRTMYDPRFRGNVPAHVVKGVTEKIAEQALETLMGQLSESVSWVKSRRNHPGYDYMIDGRVRVQVKGSDAIEQVGWTHKPDLSHPSLDYDILVFVHIGVLLSSDYGRFAQYGWRPQPCVDYYLIPNRVIREWVGHPRYLNKGRVELFWNQRTFERASKQHVGQTREILAYKNRFDLLEELIYLPAA